MIRIGLYSEDRMIFPLISSALGRDFQVQLLPEAEEAEALAAGGGCDAMLLDLNTHSDALPDRICCARAVVASGTPTIVMSDDTLRATAFELVRNGAFGYCRRPPSIRELKNMLLRAHESAAPTARLQTAKTDLERSANCDRMVGGSPAMQRVYELVHRVADLHCSILVQGESGTGKELIARAIHNLGSRADRPFVAVSCGAIPEALIEAELFGHERGAFTGSAGIHEGYFEQAGDGTLFLDEIGDLSPFTQVKLLRVLQQMEFSRLGSTRLIPLRARLVFATHRDLGKMVAEGTFRQDLYYRINVMRIEAPALKDRAEDIPGIARHFLQHYAHMFQKPMRGIEPDAMAMLERHHWPGNVRELENVLQRAIILAPAQSIRAADLILPGREDDPLAADIVDFADYQPANSFERQLRDYKVKLATQAVRDNHGNKTLAARSLGISRAYVHRLLRLAESETMFDLELHTTANS